jgi:hypothetical protein
MQPKPPSRAARQSAPDRAGRRRARLVAAGFLFAFALSIVTVVLTGLWVRSPARRTAVPPPQPTSQAVVEPAAAASGARAPERLAEASAEREPQLEQPAALDQ